MDKQIRAAFDTVHAPQRLMRITKAHLRKKTFDYGRNILQLRRRRTRLAAGLLSLTLMLTGSGLWFFPTTSISVDINPSVELKVNALDRVIVLKGRNADGMALADAVDVAGMAYDDAMQRILLSNELEPYLNQGNAVVITVAGGGNATHAEQMLSKVLCRTYNIAEKDSVFYYQVDRETLRAAKEVGLCVPGYLAWRQLQANDPSIMPEDVRHLHKDEIWELAQVKHLNNPCGN